MLVISFHAKKTVHCKIKLSSYPLASTDLPPLSFKTEYASKCINVSSTINADPLICIIARLNDSYDLYRFIAFVSNILCTNIHVFCAYQN